MKNRLLNRIHNSKHQAQHFFENSYREIVKSPTHTVYGFPELSNRDRLTEWGATSAALVGLYISSDNSPKSQTIIEKSKNWLISKQNADGSWEASDMSLSEATAGVLLDLRKIDSLSDAVLDKGLAFLETCYRDDHFISTPMSIEKPHIYTTYMVCLLLNEVAKLKHREAIKQWILNTKTANIRWGQIPKSNEETAIHTIFALTLLSICGMTWEEINSKYEKQISWIKSRDSMNFFLYEEMQFKYKSTDEYGSEYGRLRLRHFTLPIIGNFYLNIGSIPNALKIANRILNLQFSGGWGPSKDELTMWATHQSIEFLDKIERVILPGINNFNYFMSCVKGISFFWGKLIISLIGVLLAVLFLFLPNYRASFLVGIFVMLIPWFFKKE